MDFLNICQNWVILQYPPTGMFCEAQPSLRISLKEQARRQSWVKPQGEGEVGRLVAVLPSLTSSGDPSLNTPLLVST